jgi:uncharacterized protein YbcV (DUF1398 family)
MKFRDLVEQDESNKELYEKIISAANSMNRHDLDFYWFKCSIMVQTAVGRENNSLDFSLDLHYQLNEPNIPTSFLEDPINYFIERLKEAVPEFLTKEYLDTDTGRFEIRNITFTYKDILFHMQDVIKNYTRVTQWRMMAQVQDERRVSYNYWIDPNDIKQLSSDFTDLSDNLKKKVAKVYGVLRKGVIPEFKHPSGSVLLSFDEYSYELSPDYMFWMLPVLDDEKNLNGRLSPRVRPYNMKVNGVQIGSGWHEDELDYIQKRIYKKFEQFNIYISF